MLVPILIALIFVYLCYKLNFRPPNFPNGPWNLPIVGYLPFMGRRPYVTLRDVSKNYGDIFSINMGSFRAIVLSSYEMIRDGLKEENFTGRPPTRFFKFRSEAKGIILSESHTWLEVRRFTLSHLRKFGLGKSSLEMTIQEEARELIESHKKNVGKPIKLRNTFNLTALNTLWTIVTGQRFDLEDPKARAMLESLAESIKEDVTSRLAEFVPVLKLVQKIPKHMIAFDKDAKAMFKEIINEHKRMHKEGDASDFMHVFLDRMQQDEKQGISSPFTGEDGMINLIMTTFDLFIAGSETTSTTLLWLFLLLATHPDIQEKVHEELDDVVGKERLPSYDDRNSMPYTEAVLLECQRFGSVLPLGIFHYATSDTKFKGYDIPKDTIVLPNIYQVLHEPKTWEKPEEFYPGHFLTKDGTLKHVEQLIPFATGKRVCLGESLAKPELFIFSTALLQQFKFTLPAGQPKPSLIGVPAIILSPPPYDVVLSLRN